MKNILDPNILTEVNTRIEAISTDSQRLWGTMTPEQMLFHCRGQLLISNGTLPSKKAFPAPVQWLLKKTYGAGVAFSKGMATMPEIVSHEVSDLNFAEEKERLKAVLKQFVDSPKTTIITSHPIFGEYTKDDWGKIIYKHLDHHFRQFGA
jgi:hypothetical protein